MAEENTAPAAAEKQPLNPTLKLALELGPVALFVLTYNFGDRFAAIAGLTGIWEKPIFLATAVIMVATLISIITSWALTRTLPAMPLVTMVVVSVFGGLTLYLQDDLFIKLKPTIINTLFGLTLLGGMVFGKSLLRVVMDAAFSMDEEGWAKLTWRWGVFFLFLAVVNEVVWRNFSESFWVGFKLWGMTGLTFIFVASQTPLMMRHSTEEKD